MDKWIRGGYREAARGCVGYVQIDVPSHSGKIRVFEPSAECVAAQIVREHNAHAVLVEALEKCINRIEVHTPQDLGTLEMGKAALRLAKGG